MVCYIVGGGAFQICFEQTIPDATTFLHSILQVAHDGCACDDPRILCWYVILGYNSYRSLVFVPLLSRRIAIIMDMLVRDLIFLV